MPSANLAETSRERWFLWLSLVFMALYYPVLIRLFELDLFADGSQSLFRPVLNGMTFNSMMYHLLAGRFDVDPGAIGNEVFIVNGRAVSYFGIFCALIRLDLAPFLDLTRVDVTRLLSHRSAADRCCCLLRTVPACGLSWRDRSDRGAGNAGAVWAAATGIAQAALRLDIVPAASRARIAASRAISAQRPV